MIAYASAQFPAGTLSDKFGQPLIMGIGVTIFTISSLLIVSSTSFILVTCFAILIGLGTGPHKAVAIPMLSDQYQDRTGLALGIMDTIGQFGGMAAPLVVVFFLSVFVWEGFFLFTAAISIILGGIFVLSIYNSDTLSFEPSCNLENEIPEDTNVTYTDTFRDPALIGFIAVTMLFTFAWNGFSAFLPLFLVSEKGLSGSTASVLYSLLFVSSLSQTVTGEVSDRIGRLTVGLVLFVTIFLGVILLLITTRVIGLAIIALGIGVGFHGFRPVRDAYLMDLLPKNIGGGALGIIRTLMTGVGALAPGIIGLLSDTSGFTVAYGVIGVIVATGCLFMTGLLLYQNII